MSRHNSQSILGEFSRNAAGKFFIKFADATYVRSDIIILDRKDLSVHAVLGGAAHLVGYINDDLVKSVKNQDDIILSAPHYYKGALNLTAKISVN